MKIKGNFYPKEKSHTNCTAMHDFFKPFRSLKVQRFQPFFKRVTLCHLCSDPKNRSHGLAELPMRHTFFRFLYIVLLGGGLLHIFFIFTPESFGEDEPILTSMFFRWVGSTTNQYLICYWNWWIHMNPWSMTFQGFLIYQVIMEVRNLKEDPEFIRRTEWFQWMHITVCFCANYMRIIATCFRNYSNLLRCLQKRRTVGFQNIYVVFWGMPCILSR